MENILPPTCGNTVRITGLHCASVGREGKIVSAETYGMFPIILDPTPADPEPVVKFYASTAFEVISR